MPSTPIVLIKLIVVTNNSLKGIFFIFLNKKFIPDSNGNFPQLIYHQLKYKTLFQCNSRKHDFLIAENFL